MNTVYGILVPLRFINRLKNPLCVVEESLNKPKKLGSPHDLYRETSRADTEV